MSERNKVLAAISNEDLTLHNIYDVTGIPKARVEVILVELRRAGLAIKAHENSWRGFADGKGSGGYVAAAKAFEVKS